MRNIIVVCGLALSGVLLPQQQASAFNFRISGSFDWQIQFSRSNGGDFSYFGPSYPPPIYYHGGHHGETQEPQVDPKAAQTTGFVPNYMTHYGNRGVHHTVGYQTYQPGYSNGYYYPYPYYGGYFTAPYYWYGY